MTKRCTRCGRELALEAFGWRVERNAPRSQCNECRRAIARQHRAPELGADCLICGAGPFVAVGKHTWRIHGVTSKEYRQRFPGAPVTGPESRHAFALELADYGRGGGRPKRETCDRGHALRGANVIRHANGSRRCRTCKNERYREAYHAGAAWRHKGLGYRNTGARGGAMPADNEGGESQPAPSKKRKNRAL